MLAALIRTRGQHEKDAIDLRRFIADASGKDDVAHVL
jgi:hypothetical protein